jgi:pSer/pThr/pTyr-binding forkhead associated (FHA) protein
MLFCEECGQPLYENVPVAMPTRRLDASGGELAAKATWGTARFGHDAYIIVRVRDAPEPLIVQPAKRTVLGRQDANSVQKPDIDLSPYGALEKGVSRIHAVIARSEGTLTLTDMGSVNGTHLNGQRLMPDEPRVLRDGDEIRLGKLVAHVYFK